MSFTFWSRLMVGFATYCANFGLDSSVILKAFSSLSTFSSISCFTPALYAAVA